MKAFRRRVPSREARNTGSALALVLTVFPLAAGCQVGGSFGPETTSDLGAYVERWHETGRLNGVVLVARGDEVIYEGAFGEAVREWDVPNTLDTRFDIGSISKQFTTVLVLQLVAEERLRLDDPITHHLPWYRADTGDRITIDHLLRQTSGIPDYVRDWRPSPEERERGEPRLLRRHLDSDYLIRTYMSDDPFFEPGSRYRYSSSNHFLLGRIIEEVTGRSFGENLQARLLGPLGLADTGLLHPGRVIHHLAAGYARIPQGEGRGQYYYAPSLYGPGGMYSSARDLHRWNRAVEEGALLPDSLNALLFEPYIRDADGVRHGYAVGYFDLRLQGSEEPIPYTGFSGAIDGFRTDAFRFPETGHIVVILDNSEQYEHWRIAPGIYRILMGVEAEMPRVLASVEVAREALNAGVETAVARAREVRSDPTHWSGVDLLEYDLDHYASRYLAIGRKAEAIRLWSLGTALNPNSPEAWRSLAAGYRAAARDSLAGEAGSRADALERQTEELLALIDAREFEAAKERIRALEPGATGAPLFSSADVGPRYGRAFQAGELEIALGIAEVWALGNPEIPGPLFSMANVYKAMNRPERALECYRRILALEIQGPWIERAREEIAGLGGGDGLGAGDDGGQDPASYRLTHHPSWDYHPTFSPDGTRVLFTSQRTGQPSLWIVPAEGGEPSPVPLEGSGDLYSSWAPDGQSIAIDLREDGGPPELFRYWFESGELQRLTRSPGPDAHPAFSPDGREVLFTSVRDGSMDPWIMNADGSGARPVFRDDAGDWHPSWSPNGRRILFESDRGGGESQLWMVNRDGSNLEQLTHGPGQASRASWSPDGTLILFQRDEDLWVVSPEGGEPVRLLDRPGQKGNAAWSPDGTRIVASVREGNNSDLWIYTPDPRVLERARR